MKLETDPQTGMLFFYAALMGHKEMQPCCGQKMLVEEKRKKILVLMDVGVCHSRDCKCE